MSDYIRIELKITEFDAEDVITTSGAPGPDEPYILPTNPEDETPWSMWW